MQVQCRVSMTAAVMRPLAVVDRWDPKQPHHHVGVIAHITGTWLSTATHHDDDYEMAIILTT